MPASTRSLTRLEAQERRALLDVADYAISLDLSPAATGDLRSADTSFGSRTTIHFTSGAGTSFLDLHPVRVQAARLDGSPLDVDRLDHDRLPLDLDAGDHELVVEATMAFRHDGEGLHLAHDPADDRSYVYAMSFMDAAPSWFACFDQPDLKAAVSLDLRVPVDWTVRGNAPIDQVDPGHWRLGPTPPLATYAVAVVAGPWHVISDHHDGIDLGLSARASLADVLERDAEDLLTVTRQSFDELHRRFGIRYPFGDYHQAFVPEFNAGAMENPGCVTFRDGFLSTSRLTRGSLAARASTIAHEMAHQWFGNLVTPVWWDDLWLNESFAEHLGTRVTADCTQYDDIRVGDVHDRRQWGLVTDQRPTTHPVAGNGAADAAEALQNFDGISYAKGASVLGQLCAALGDDVFFGGVIDHLERHRFGNATASDLIGSWERAGAGDLGGFVDGWLLSAGPDRLELDRAAGVLVRTPPAEHPADRSHTVEVAVHRDGDWQREQVTLAAQQTAFAAGNDPVLIDPSCRTWALVVPDPETVQALVTLLPPMTDPMLRATTWNSLRNAFHNAALDPLVALDLVVAALPLEDPDDGEPHTLSWLYGDLIVAQPDPGRARARVHAAARARLPHAAAGSDEQLSAFRCAAATAHEATTLRAWGDGHDLPDGLTLDVDLRWRLLRRLAELGETDVAELDRSLADDLSVDARIAHTRARASLPTDAAKQWAWDRFTGRVQVPNHEVVAAGSGLWQPGQDGQGGVTERFVADYFDELRASSARRSGWTLAEAAGSFYPRVPPDQALLDLTLAASADDRLEVSLRRLLIDRADQVRRMLAVRAAFPSSTTEEPRQLDKKEPTRW